MNTSTPEVEVEEVPAYFVVCHITGFSARQVELQTRGPYTKKCATWLRKRLAATIKRGNSIANTMYDGCHSLKVVKQPLEKIQAAAKKANSHVGLVNFGRNEDNEWECNGDC